MVASDNNEICLLLPNCNYPARGFIYEKWVVTHPQTNDEIVIADVAFDILPTFTLTIPLEIASATFILLTLLRFFITPYRWVILRRYFFLQGVVYFVRGLCVFTTILPDPSGRTSTVNTSNIIIEGFLVLLGVHRVECDMMFSGNAASMVLCACLWHHYSHKAPIIEFDPLGDTPNATPYGYPLRLTLVKLLAWLYHNYILFIATRKNILNTFFRWFETGAPDIPAIIKVPMNGITSSDVLAN
ncbi:Sphingomyelin synthase-like domain-containing protein [Entamoeba marina]